MTIALASHTEARLREKVAREDRDPAALLLKGLLNDDEREPVSVTDAVNHAPGRRTGA